MVCNPINDHLRRSKNLSFSKFDFLLFISFQVSDTAAPAVLAVPVAAEFILQNALQTCQRTFYRDTAESVICKISNCYNLILLVLKDIIKF